MKINKKGVIIAIIVFLAIAIPVTVYLFRERYFDIRDRASDEPSGEAVLKYGSGDDGECIVSANTNINTGCCVGRSSGDAVNFSVTADVSAGSNTVALGSGSYPTGLAVGDQILIINLKGTSTEYSDVGEYEFALISSIDGNTLTLSNNLLNGYDGTTQKVMVQRVPQYTDVTVNEEKNLYPSDWDGTKGGVLAFKATGTVTVTGTIHADNKGLIHGTGAPVASSIRATGGESPFGSGGSGGCNQFTNCLIGEDGTAAGGGGGSSLSGFSAGVGGSGSEALGGGGGGGGSAYGSYAPGGGGGGGGYGTAGAGGDGHHSDGSAGSIDSSGEGGYGSYFGTANSNGSGGGGGGGGTYGVADLSTIFMGSGGGGGGSREKSYRGMNGGDGGGIVIIFGDTIDIGGSVSSKGESGYGSSSTNGAGGGGAGGSVLITSDEINIGADSSIDVEGGLGGSGGTYGQAGGDGGDGRVGTVSNGNGNGNGTNLLGDIDGDGDVDMQDYALFVEDYLNYKNNGVYNERSDLNSDEKINMADYSLFVESYIENN